MGKKKIFIIFFCIVVFLGVIFCVPYFYINNKLSKVETVKFEYSEKELGIDEKKIRLENMRKNKIENKYVHILLLGIDALDTASPSRSDTMMIATIDKEHQKIKLTSLMRDTLVTMQGHGPLEGLNEDRLNHAFAYGGPLLAIKTVNENFDMSITNYVQVDFQGFAKMIDCLGGVEINLSEAEVEQINDNQQQVSKLDHQNFVPVVKAGVQNLNGKQAVGYCRIRYVGNNDFERTERQRKVLVQLFKKLSQKNVMDINFVTDSILPYVKTSMDKKEIFSLGYYILANRLSTVEQLRLPSDDLSYSTYVNNQYFIGWQKEATINKLYTFIYQMDNASSKK